MQYKSAILLLLGASSFLVSAHANQNQEPGVAKLLEFSPAHHAPRDLAKRQTPEQVCGINYVLCDSTHCCEEGQYCQLRSGIWYCPLLLNSYSYTPRPTTTSKFVYTTSNLLLTTSDLLYYSTSTDIPTDEATTGGNEEPTPTDADGDSTPTHGTGRNQSKKKGIGGGAIAGIIIAVVVLLLIAIGGFIWAMKKKKKAAAAPPVAPPAGPYPPPPPMAQQPQPQAPFSPPPPQPQPYYAPQAAPYPTSPTPQPQYAPPGPQYGLAAAGVPAGGKVDGGYYAPPPQGLTSNPVPHYQPQPYAPPQSPQPYYPAPAAGPVAATPTPQAPPPPQNVYEMDSGRN